MTRSAREMLQEGLGFHRAGSLQEASDCYAEILRLDPANAEACFYMASVSLQQGRFDDAIKSAQRAIALDPGFARAHGLLGRIFLRLGHAPEALASLDRAISIAPDLAELYGARGDLLLELNRAADAVADYERAVALQPNSIADWLNYGAALASLSRHEEAIGCYDRLLALKPDHAEGYFNRAISLAKLGRDEDALRSCDKALEIRPDYLDALNNRGNILSALGRLEEAAACFEAVLAQKPDSAQALNNLGNVQQKLRQYEQALQSYGRALAVRHDFAEALSNQGNTLQRLRRYEEAIAKYDDALTLQPENAEIHLNRGVALGKLKRFDASLACFEQAIRLRPEYAAAYSNRGLTLHELRRYDEALADYDRAIAIEPENTEVLFNRGSTLCMQKQYEAAMGCFERVLTLAPDHPHAVGAAADCALHICDWDRHERFGRRLRDCVGDNHSIISPFLLLGYFDDAGLQLRCTQKYLRHELQPAHSVRAAKRRVGPREKCRVAYLSADFRDHPVSHLAAELFEAHDRSHFEIIGVSIGPNDGSQIRKRLLGAFDQFHDVFLDTDQNIAKLLEDSQIDIVVNLTGLTDGGRPGILVDHPVPVQVSYLGYSATMGAPFMDYIIADPRVLPMDQQQYYSEKIVHLPNCFLVNDRKRRISSETPTRAEAGLPPEGFVFCAFNNNWKFVPEVFEVWMRLLGAVEGSVLWLSGTNSSAVRNMRDKASACGINPERIVFAARLVDSADHLARHRLADVFLDTLPYNAHATASDALWAGLPVVTCCGQSFAARVATSLLDAVGLPELITVNLVDYEQLALRLARDPQMLSGVKCKLTKNRDTHPLFDSARFTRDIEAAYKTMWGAARRGEAPRAFCVAA